MEHVASRREMLGTVAAAAAGLGLTPRGSARAGEAAAGADIRVVVWDEQQPTQKQAYPNYLGNAIAEHLRRQPGLSVGTARLDDPHHGLGPEVLDNCRVLIWWGHVRQQEITPETGQAIVRRIKEGSLSLVVLHSAHWSTPFVEAMYERARLDAARTLAGTDRGRDAVELTEVPPPRRYTTPRADDPPTPRLSSVRKYPDGRLSAKLHLPYCCFPAYRHDGKPSQVRVLKPDHPIAAGLPAVFEISRTEMYDEPFHVPEPDALLFEERWPGGEWFRSGMLWRLGKGHVFYFRPGHETYPVYLEPLPLKVVANAARWLGQGTA